MKKTKGHMSMIQFMIQIWKIWIRPKSKSIAPPPTIKTATDSTDPTVCTELPYKCDVARFGLFIQKNLKKNKFRMVNPDDPDYDIYRDSLLRYAGYANEVGEAFRAQESDYFSS